MSVREVEDAGVLQKPTDDGTHANVLRSPGNARAKATEPPHDQIDRHTGAGGFAERLNDLRVFELVHFGHDTRRLSRAPVIHLACNQLQQPQTHGRRRHQQRIA